MRQKPIGNYIVDFFCSKLKLIIEIDGDIDKEQYDQKRQAELEALRLSVLRFSDLDVKQNMEGVLQAIVEWIDKNGTS